MLETSTRTGSTVIAPKRVQHTIKRLFDLMVAATLLVLLSPLLFAVALAVKISGPGPMLYRQRRLMREGREFTLIKFRTMVDGADTMVSDLFHLNEANGPLFKVRNDPRVTPLGKVLRRTFVDELPQLVNVLRGEMSLVGPRPCLPHEAAVMPEEISLRFRVPQGMTGPWQTNGHHGLTFEEQLQVEVEYVKSWSLMKDFVILARTIPLVFRWRGA
jgi:lipopolysaccharide/colanic/teichoic acid biosynthesis glycosyltransferase